ncbi:membrane-associated phospholipid phosphatase [Arthrobacter globiformis]|uniref:phosphatase PAP2 family protein n=1 Tax=Arthrobacter globiformis TaxID=1665 RepID=UPI00278AF27F|nr:phosphatase PAP2 family protein [Arthrobacter globiformis]MDQ1056195.1 membrane-associated phospholipid phosphatase [Arthrobacter globiformis]
MGEDRGIVSIRVKNRVARIVTEALQPPITVALLLLLSPAMEPGFPGTVWFGAVAVLFVCVLPLAAVVVLVRLGKVTDHHVSDRKQRAPVLAMSTVSLLAGLGVLLAINAPYSVIVVVLAIVGGVVVLAVISLFWKISGHAGAIALTTVITVLILGVPWIPLLLLIPAVGWSRVVLRAHTVAQVVAGALVGGGVTAGLWWLLRELLVRIG